MFGNLGLIFKVTNLMTMCCIMHKSINICSVSIKKVEISFTDAISSE